MSTTSQTTTPTLSKPVAFALLAEYELRIAEWRRMGGIVGLAEEPRPATALRTAAHQAHLSRNRQQRADYMYMGLIDAYAHSLGYRVLRTLEAV